MIMVNQCFSYCKSVTWCIAGIAAEIFVGCNLYINDLDNYEDGMITSGIIDDEISN